MPDQLQKLYDEWFARQQFAVTHYQAFQGGLSAGALSMRTRAIAEIQKTKLDNNPKNALLTAIGLLSDIPPAQ